MFSFFLDIVEFFEKGIAWEMKVESEGVGKGRRRDSKEKEEQRQDKTTSRECDL